MSEYKIRDGRGALGGGSVVTRQVEREGDVQAGEIVKLPARGRGGSIFISEFSHK